MASGSSDSDSSITDSVEIVFDGFPKDLIRSHPTMEGNYYTKEKVAEWVENVSLSKVKYKKRRKYENYKRASSSVEKSDRHRSEKKKKHKYHSKPCFHDGKDKHERNLKRMKFSSYTGSNTTKKTYNTPRHDLPVNRMSADNSYEHVYYDTGYNFAKDRKKGLKTKRYSETNPIYKSPDSFESDHISKQRKFDKRQSGDSWKSYSLVKSRGWKYEKYHHKKNSNFSVPFLKQNYDGWGNIETAQNENSIWESTDQSDIKWSEDDCTNKKKIEVVSHSHHNGKGRKTFRGNSDDGGWSSVEEGEIISSDDDDFKENKYQA